MNKEFFKLEELLNESGIPFFFNYREENRPTPLGILQVNMQNEDLLISVGPPVYSEAVCVSPAGPGDEDLLKVVLPGGLEQNEAVTADVALAMLESEFLKRRAEWWPEVYGNEK